MRAKLIRLYSRASKEQRDAGESWYSEGQKWCTAVANEAGRSVRTIAGVVAALSPRLTWARNKELASQLVSGVYTKGAFKANVVKARAILAGKPPEAVLGGPKVRAFFAALVGDTSAAVIDVWILRALGLTTVSAKLYASISRAMTAASNTLKVSVRALQATIWVLVRGSAQ